MTILENIEECSERAGIITTLYVDLFTENEFTAKMKSITSAEQCPVHIINRFETQGNWETGRRKVLLPLSGFVVTRIKQNTKTTRTRELEDACIEAMSVSCKKFLREVIRSTQFDVSRTMTDTIRAAYQVSNEHLFGVSYTAQIPLTDNCIC